MSDKKAEPDLDLCSPSYSFCTAVCCPVTRLQVGIRCVQLFTMTGAATNTMHGSVLVADVKT